MSDITYHAKQWAAHKKAKTKGEQYCSAAERMMDEHAEKILENYEGENIETPSVIVTVRKGYNCQTISLDKFIEALKVFDVTDETIALSKNRAMSESRVNPTILKVEGEGLEK